MNPVDTRRQDPDSDEPPAWALTYADAALQCGLKAPEIETRLIHKGLSPSIAQSVVPRCFERRFHAIQRSEMWATRRKVLSRAASLVIAMGYLVLAAFTGGPESVLRTILFLLLPLGCIWFPQAFGTYLRRPSWVGPYFTSPTPGPLVAIGGWLVLLLSVIVRLIMMGMHHHK